MTRLASGLIMGSITFIVQFYANRYYEEDRQNYFKNPPVDYSLPQVKTYDFIIVGGGTAGCVLARRLADSSKSWRILVLEAGGEVPQQTFVPGYGYFTVLKELTFPYITLQNQMVPVPRALGGSTALNEKYFNRGSPYGYDDWVTITGDSSWSYRNVLKYFKKLETYDGNFPHTDQHGYSGPIPVTSTPTTVRTKLWNRAATELGFPILDPNGPQRISMAPIEIYTKFGRRHSTYEAYLRPIQAKHKRLVIEKYATATRIELDEDNERALGVEYMRHGVRNYARATKEIIISAGVYGSPQVLLRSGIGSTQELRRLNIKQRVNLPVGERLKDHPTISLFIKVNQSDMGFDRLKDFEFEDIPLYLKHGKGSLSVGHQKVGQVFAASKEAKERGEADWADMYVREHATFPVNVSQPPLKENERIVNAWGYASRPYSVGVFRINPADADHPFIDCSLLSDKRDIETLLQVLHLMVDIFEGTKAYQSIGGTIVNLLNPVACRHLTFKTDEYWRCYIQETVQTAYNAVGTCPMGKLGDPHAVVDSQMRVFRVKGLRVIDGSVMPDVPNANTQAATLMIGEKGAALVINTWKNEEKVVEKASPKVKK